MKIKILKSVESYLILLKNFRRIQINVGLSKVDQLILILDIYDNGMGRLAWITIHNNWLYSLQAFTRTARRYNFRIILCRFPTNLTLNCICYLLRTFRALCSKSCGGWYIILYSKLFCKRKCSNIRVLLQYQPLYFPFKMYAQHSTTFIHSSIPLSCNIVNINYWCYFIFLFCKHHGFEFIWNLLY